MRTSKCISFLLIPFISAMLNVIEMACADMVYFNDGTTLQCRVLSESADTTSGQQFIRVQISNSNVLINRQVVSRVEKTPYYGASSEETQRKLDELMKEGSVVATKDIDDTTPDEETDETQEQFPLAAKTVKGWGYLYEDITAYNQGNRKALREGEPVPMGNMLVVSPNSRITLSIGDVGVIGLEGQTRIRFDEIGVNRAQTYVIDLNLSEGAFWTKIGDTPDSWKRVKFIINSAQMIVQQGVFYTNSLSRTGAVNIVHVEGNSDTKFWRSTEVPVNAAVGEAVDVSPGSIRLKVHPTENLDEIQQTIENWDEWTPEPLVVELEPVLPPLKTFDEYPSVPVLHPYRITLDPSMAFPPETRSLGEIFGVYHEAIERFEFDTGTYPNPEHGLDALFEPYNIAGWKGPYLPQSTPRSDYWGVPFRYERFDTERETYFDVRSLGPNEQDDHGFGDDIR